MTKLQQQKSNYYNIQRHSEQQSINLITFLMHIIGIVINECNYSCFKCSLGFNIHISFVLFLYLPALISSLEHRAMLLSKLSMEFTSNHRHWLVFHYQGCFRVFPLSSFISLYSLHKRLLQNTSEDHFLPFLSVILILLGLLILKL